MSLTIAYSADDAISTRWPPEDIDEPLRQDARLMPSDFNAKDYVDAKLETVRAQNDARFSDVLNEVRSLRDDVKRIPSLWQIFAAVVSSMAVAAGLAFGFWAIAGDQFANGLSLADQRQQQLQRDASQDQKLDAILNRLDALVAQPPTPAPRTGATPDE